VKRPVEPGFGRAGAGSLAGLLAAVVVATLTQGAASEGSRSLALSVTATVIRSCSIAAGESLTISCARRASTTIPIQILNESPAPTSASLRTESRSPGMIVFPVAGASASPAVSVRTSPNSRTISIEF
jgi:hypothetical protein